MVPRTLFRARGNPGRYKAEAGLLVREHWTRERIMLVVIGLVSFYVTYVSYRNIKNFLPFIMRDGDGPPTKYDYALHRFDTWLLFGHDPSSLLHHWLGTGVAAYVLSWIYLIFLPMVPVSIVIWAVWSRNVSFGYWFITAQCICWALGTASYYAIPTLGPNFFFPWLYSDLPHTGVAHLQDALFYGRQEHPVQPVRRRRPVGGGLRVAARRDHRQARSGRAVHPAHQGVPGRAVGLRRAGRDLDDVLRLALHRRRHRWAAIALFAVYLAALGTGQKFDRGVAASRTRRPRPVTSPSSRTSDPLESHGCRLSRRHTAQRGYFPVKSVPVVTPEA